MPEKDTIERSRQAKREGKSPSTQAGEFVREEFKHIQEGRHGARSPQQAIAIGLSKARRAGVRLPPPKGKASPSTRVKAAQDSRAGSREGRRAPSRTRSRAVLGALKREGSQAASFDAMSRQGRASASRRSRANRQQAAAKAVRTKGAEGRSNAARKAARTRERRRSR